MNMNSMNNLSNKIDNFAMGNWGRPEDCHAALWQDIDNLRNNNNKAELLENWKYKHEFMTVEQSHQNGRKDFNLCTWEQSFVVAILFHIFH